ncbi:MAG: sigma-70 family RNA polymerase sigma factor [Oscillospiraceae bacterium]|jgi:RNA polymerase sporulation-specific sigma factor|nr:sigma-70 family RNA polymerase sigma factor [Oscillospiraceae bacterium]
MNSLVTNEFAKCNMGLVHSLANRFRGRGIEYEELFSAGCIGLVKAGNNFDKGRGLQFSTYAVPVILGEIKRLFRDGGAVKVSRGLKELSLKVARVREQLSQNSNGQEPRLSDIALALNITIEQVSEALSVNMPPLSLTDSDESGSEYDLPVVAPQVKLTELIALKQSLGQLEPEDRKLIILRYWGNKTQGETGEALGMSQVQVSRKERKILDELKKQLV